MTFAAGNVLCSGEFGRAGALDGQAVDLMISAIPGVI